MISGLKKLFQWRLNRVARRNAKLRAKVTREVMKVTRPTVVSRKNIFQLARISRRAEKRVTDRRFENRYVKPDVVPREMKRRFVLGTIFSRT